MTFNNADLWVNASLLWPCWPMAHAVTRERGRGWPGGQVPWKVLCCDVVRDRPTHLPPRKAPLMETTTVFLTDGTTFLGPYLADEMGPRINGERHLREVCGAEDVYSISAKTEEQAKRAWSSTKPKP